MNKNKNESPYLMKVDLSDMEKIFDLAILGAGTNRDTLKKVLLYEEDLSIRIVNTLKLIKENSKMK